MSQSKRRWSNEFMDSLIDFRSKDTTTSSIHKTVLFDSLESKRIEVSDDSLDNKCTNITSMLSVKNESTNFLQEFIKNKCAPKILTNDLNTKKSMSFTDDINLNMIEDNDTSNEDLNSRLTIDDVNINTSIINKDISDSSEYLSVGSNQNNYLNNLNKSLRENSTLSIENEIGEEYYYELSDQTKIEPIKNKCIKNPTISSSSKAIDPFFCNSNIQFNLKTNSTEQQIYHSPTEDSKEANQNFFSSPLQYFSNDQEMITEMNKPDIWDALLALEQALSPVEEKTQDIEEYSQKYPHILSRLSQQFKKTPTRFTEKLVSIIEDSVISSESPIKQHLDDNSGISLHRITGEFRKLCKFIEDESMPELAPSLMNMTDSYFENTPTPESRNFKAIPKNILRLINDTPKHRTTPEKSNCFQTPKNKIISNINSPINQFTPTADKSFEYWETVCNIMCGNKVSDKKNTKNLIMSDSPKINMNKMLTICERQMASLDDSTIDIRSSEPCKNIDNVTKLEIDQIPRSKSESKIIFNTTEKRKQMHNKHEEVSDNDYKSSNGYQDLKINNLLIFNNASKFQENIDLEEKTKRIYDFQLLDNKDLSQNEEESFENFEFLENSPEKIQHKIIENSYNDDEQNSSLLIELAKRRQRCLDTAKLMLEIDKEDPITHEDSKCLETLYKLGIQNKTFVEVEEDTKFLNTLSQCIDYKNYISVKSKPLLNMLNELNSPDDVKNKATSILRSKKQFNYQNISDRKTKNQQKSTVIKSRTDSNINFKNKQDKKIANKFILKSTPQNVKIEKNSQLLNIRKTKETPRGSKTPSHLLNVEKIKPTPREILKTPTPVIQHKEKNILKVETSERKVIKQAISKPLTKILQSDQRLHTSPKNLTPNVVSTVPLKTNLQSKQHKITVNITPKASNSKIVSNIETNDDINKYQLLHEHQQVITPPLAKPKFFLTPGKNSKSTTIGRKKPQSYFLDEVSKKTTPLKNDYNTVKSPISLYIHGTDTDLIQNVHGRINDRLLTPISSKNAGNSPRLKFALSSKENQSPNTNCDENFVLPTVRYQSAKNVHLINEKSSYSPSSLTPNSKTKKLLGPIENTLVIRHKGRVLDYSPESDCIASETSVRVQKMAEKTISTKEKYI